ncbi:hypothetical protein AC249_AIPGENE19046 [Exaiptasia diaphana]|nr:hypothetical protein AC249_AIPGENE19046 [Exaiptasia diaphana]
MSSSLSELPLAMGGLDEDINRHYSSTYDQKISTYYDDLSTVWESMYRKGLRKQLSCYYTYQPIEQDADIAIPNRLTKGGKDLARVHHERALDAGKLRRDKGRRWRRKNYSSSLESQSSHSSSLSTSSRLLDYIKSLAKTNGHAVMMKCLKERDNHVQNCLSRKPKLICLKYNVCFVQEK